MIKVRRFALFCRKIQYVGLLGILGLLIDNSLLRCFLWFWWFGFFDLVYNFPLHLQSIKQLWSMLVIPLRYGSNIPSALNYQCKVKYSLPFEGEWTVVNGSSDKEHSHSWDIPDQRYAYDFLILDQEGRSFIGDSGKVESYYCYGKNILAAADGEVIKVLTSDPDSIILGNGKADCASKNLFGNYILIRHADNEYGLYAHLKPQSICVNVGDRVQRGQVIAQCGNSGNSTEPHLHFQLQNGTSLFTSAGLPVEFLELSVQSAPSYIRFDPRPISIDTSSMIRGKYIMRGQRVANL